MSYEAPSITLVGSVTEMTDVGTLLNGSVVSSGSGSGSGSRSD